MAGALAIAGLAQAACPPGLRAVHTARLIFGRDIDQTVGVSEADWRGFVDQEVTPRFPDGFTVQDAIGQWRGADGRLVREPSEVLMIVLSGAPGENDRLSAIRSAYRRRFHQDSVLLIEEGACAGF